MNQETDDVVNRYFKYLGFLRDLKAQALFFWILGLVFAALTSFYVRWSSPSHSMLDSTGWRVMMLFVLLWSVIILAWRVLVIPYWTKKADKLWEECQNSKKSTPVSGT